MFFFSAEGSGGLDGGEEFSLVLFSWTSLVHHAYGVLCRCVLSCLAIVLAALHADEGMLGSWVSKVLTPMRASSCMIFRLFCSPGFCL